MAIKEIPDYLTTQDIENMRDWLKDLSFEDIEPEDMDELSAVEVMAAVNRHWDGGINNYLKSNGLIKETKYYRCTYMSGVTKGYFTIITDSDGIVIRCSSKSYLIGLTLENIKRQYNTELI